MKFTINIECTPEEAREFMGLPDAQKLQEHMMQTFKDQFPDLAGQMPEGMQESMTEGVKQWQDIQNAFWAQMMTPYGVSQPSEAQSSRTKKTDKKDG